MKTSRHPVRNPWANLDALANDVSRMFEPPRMAHLALTPTVDVAERETELILTAEIPGMRPEEIEINVENNILTISGERTVVREENEEFRYHLRERASGTFKRSFTLPRTVRTDAISADYDHGILTIQIPKSAEARSRRIEIGAPAQA